MCTQEHLASQAPQGPPVWVAVPVAREGLAPRAAQVCSLRLELFLNMPVTAFVEFQINKNSLGITLETSPCAFC